MMLPEELERQIAMSTTAGREGLAVRDNVVRAMTGAQKVAKAFELTETMRQVMRSGLRRANPDASEVELQEMYVDRLLQYHNLSLAAIRRRQRKLESDHCPAKYGGP